MANPLFGEFNGMAVESQTSFASEINGLRMRGGMNRRRNLKLLWLSPNAVREFGNAVFAST